MIKSIYKTIFSDKTRMDIRERLNRLSYLYYIGNKYSCNCCRKSFRKMKKKGNVIRENAKCPYCSSLERTRLLLFYLQNETKIFTASEQRILHFAPEKAIFDLLKNTHKEYIDCDINPAFARNVVDITNIPYPDDYFDIIICSHVLGHVKNEKKAISELQRVIKANTGTVLVLTLLNLKANSTFEDSKIITPSERLKFYGEQDLYRLHGQDFQSRLQQEGFTVNRVDYRQNMTKNALERYRLGNGEREIIFACKKNCKE